MIQTNIDNVAEFIQTLSISSSDGIPDISGKDWEELNSKFRVPIK